MTKSVDDEALDLDDAFLEDVKRRLRESSAKGTTTCPCCEHRVKLYKDMSADGLVSEQEKVWIPLWLSKRHSRMPRKM